MQTSLIDALPWNAVLTVRDAAIAFGPALLPASGSPGVLFWLFFLLCWYIGAAILVAFSRTPRMWRATGIALYVVAAVPAWIWYLNVPGPADLVMEHILIDILMAALPLVLVIMFVLLSRMHRRRRAEG